MPQIVFNVPFRAIRPKLTLRISDRVRETRAPATDAPSHPSQAEIAQWGRGASSVATTSSWTGVVVPGLARRVDAGVRPAWLLDGHDELTIHAARRRR